MTVSPASALEDVPVSVTLSGLPAGARTTVTATATDTAGVPSCIFVDAVAFRLTQHHFGHPVTALKHPDGGHFVGPFATSYVSATAGALDVGPNGVIPGGTLPATLAGAADSHARLLALLSSL